MTFSSEYVVADGIRTHYLRAGRGRPLILLHGGGAGADAYGNWRDCIPYFAAHYEVFAVDLVGFGRTDKPSPASHTYSLDGMIRHAGAVVDALGLREVSLIGNSMGGATSVGLTIERPDRVRKLVLMGSAGLWKRQGGGAESMMKFSPTREAMRNVMRSLTNPSFPIDEALLEHRLASIQQPGALDAYLAWTAWIAEAGGIQIDEDRIRAIKTPTLVVNGKDDKVIPVEQAFRYTQLIENSWFYLMPHCGHWAMIERTDDFCAVTLHFLDGQ